MNLKEDDLVSAVALVVDTDETADGGGRRPPFGTLENGAAPDAATGRSVED